MRNVRFVCAPGSLGDLVKSQKTVSTIVDPMTEYSPLEVWPVPFKLAQDAGMPEYVGFGLTSAYPIKFWNPLWKWHHRVGDHTNSIN